MEVRERGLQLGFLVRLFDGNLSETKNEHRIQLKRAIEQK